MTEAGAGQRTTQIGCPRAAPRQRRCGGLGPAIDRRKAIIGLAAALLLGGAVLTGLGEIAHLGRLENALRDADKV